MIAIVVHVFARAASFTHYHPLDGLTHAVAAYRFWQADVTFFDLVPDKPPGQWLLTGWCYLLAPDPPTRIVMIPIESVFLLASYVVFYRLAKRLVSKTTAAISTLFFVIAFNVYNVLDFVTDGFNLNENYLALPMILAVYVHLFQVNALKRGLLQGLAIGTALTIKQSAVGLTLVLVVSECLRSLRPFSPRAWIKAMTASVIGVVIALLPPAVILSARGWLVPHLKNLWELTGGHVQQNPWQFPRWYNIEPLLPVLTVFLWTIIAWATRDGDRLKLRLCSDPMTTEKNRPSEGQQLSSIRPECLERALIFLSLWAAVEIAILWSMKKPASHFYQQIVAPLTLLAGLGWNFFAMRANRLSPMDRSSAFRWAGLTTAAATLIAAGPIFSEASRRIHSFDYSREVKRFHDGLFPPPPRYLRAPEFDPNEL